ncbi:MAG: metallophosphoesterase family protein [Solirubrobacteraceae bacterium]
MGPPELLPRHLRWPRRTAAAREEELLRLGFVREAPTRWLDPALLVRSGVQAVVSVAFGRFADRRETQANLDQPVFDAYADRDEVWLDYVSDTGDGWPATMTMAWLLGRPELAIAGEAGALPRADVLLVGGDLVYPAAERVAYEHRFVGPFAGALPWAHPAPHLFAIPGNHDWYDGLVAFTRRFCQQQWIGGWQTWQRRSYAALKLPHGWWVWMLDIQLDELVDDAQLDWFRAAGAQMQDGDRVILLTGKPSWLRVSEAAPFPPAWENLAYVERIIREAGGEVGLVLTGDLHHYARYASPAGPPRITAGGGGAYLSPTHTLPDRVDLPPKRGQPGVPYKQAAVYPDAKRSRSLSRGVLKLASLSPGLAAIVGGVYALLAAAILTAIAEGPGNVAASARAGGLDGFISAATSGTAVVLALLLAGALIAQLDAPPPWRQLFGVAHAALHIVVCGLVVYVVAALVFSADAETVAVWPAALLAAGLMGALAGTTILAAVMLFVSITLGRRAKETANQVFAAQGLQDDKSFLRLHIDRDGALHVHALGVDEICRDWTGPHDDRDDARFRPAAGREPRVRRIDEMPPV